MTSVRPIFGERLTAFTVAPEPPRSAAAITSAISCASGRLDSMPMS
jgi:hypothetical protein